MLTNHSLYNFLKLLLFHMKLGILVCSLQAFFFPAESLIKSNSVFFHNGRREMQFSCHQIWLKLDVVLLQQIGEERLKKIANERGIQCVSDYLVKINLDSYELGS